MNNSLEAKIVVLGAQGVGKTSLVLRYVSNSFTSSTSTVGPSFLTKRVLHADSNTTVRLQIWDTAGQERFRSISKLYYRGADAAILCYDTTDEKSFEEMGRWLKELREFRGVGGESGEGGDVVIHVVGTKTDIVAEDPGKRRVPFERCIAYVAEHLYPTLSSTPPPSSGGLLPTFASMHSSLSATASASASALQSPSLSKRSSGFWGQDVGWDTCHEISAKDGEGVEEVFRVITRKLVERRNRKLELEEAAERAAAAKSEDGNNNGFGADGERGRRGRSRGGMEGGGSFRVGHGDKRRSWLGLPGGGVSIHGPGGGGQAWEGGTATSPGTEEEEGEVLVQRKGGRCC